MSMPSESDAQSKVVRIDGAMLALLYQIADEYGVSLQKASEILARQLAEPTEKDGKIFPPPDELF